MKIGSGLWFLTVLVINGWTSLSAGQRCSDQDYEQKLFDPKHSVCLQRYLNHTLLIEEFNIAIIEDNLPDFMNNNCPKWRNTLECFDAYYSELHPCLNYFQRLAVKMVRKLIEASISYLCSHNGEKLIKFVAEDGLDCILRAKDELKDCGAGLIGEDLISTISLQEGHVPKVNFSSRMFTGNECRVVYNTSHCMIDVLERECSNTSFQFASNLIINLIKQTPCWGILGLLDVQWEHYLFALLLPKHIPVKDRICNDSRSAFDVAQNGLRKGSKCWNDVVDNDFLLSDLQHALESRTVYSFLKKYCPKLHGIAACVGDYMDSFQQCVGDEDGATLNGTKSIVQGVANFVCHRDGERILLFLKENGFECLEEKKDSIRKCVNSTGALKMFGNWESEIEFSDSNFSPISFLSQIWVPQNYSPAECKLLVSLEVCVYKMMRQCKQTSPANLISSLVRSVAKRSPCWDVNGTGSANTFKNVPVLTVGILLTVLYTYIELH